MFLNDFWFCIFMRYIDENVELIRYSVYEGGGYDGYSIEDSQGRKWKVVYDGSIRPQMNSQRTASSECKVEMVSPICRYEDIEDIQNIVRKLRKEGHAKVNDSCGIHIHILETL